MQYNFIYMECRFEERTECEEKTIPIQAENKSAAINAGRKFLKTLNDKSNFFIKRIFQGCTQSNFIY